MSGRRLRPPERDAAAYVSFFSENESYNREDTYAPTRLNSRSARRSGAKLTFIFGKLTLDGGGGRGNRIIDGGRGGKNVGKDDCLEGLLHDDCRWRLLVFLIMMTRMMLCTVN